MNIKLTTPFKSLGEFEAIDLPNFCLITGRNGSGKSQLVEVIDLFRQGTNRNIQLNVNRMKIQIGGMNPPSTSYLDSGILNSTIGGHWGNYASSLHYMPTLEKLYIENPTLTLTKITKQSLENAITEVAIPEVRRALDGINQFSNPSSTPDIHYIQTATQSIYDKKESLDIARMVALQAKKDLSKIQHADFMSFPPEERFLDRNDLFSSSIEQIFYSYAKRRHLNYIHWFANEQLGKNLECLSDNEFGEKYQPPWVTINKIFKNNKLNYSFQEISPESFVDNAPIDFRLIKNSNGSVIEFANLSSGEKIIIGLIVKLFTSEYYEKNLELPELIVLDEPDAYLHPELSKLLISVLNETFVKELGIKVIVITHSPSTVALTPEDSIHELQNEPFTSLKKVTKDEALKILTHGVPTLSVDYRNHRQVFVESPTDVFYYRTLFDVFSQKETLAFKPYFISYSKGKGNCDQVISLVKDLKRAGNDKVFGIIDWDNKNSSAENIYVHGENARYSIENFLYDPIYLVELFLDIEAENISKELGFPMGYKHYDLGEIEAEDRLQEIANWVIERIRLKFKGLSGKNGTVNQVIYSNGKKLELPKWYIQVSGHELEEKIRLTFPALGKYKNDGQLQEELTKIVAKSYPFWPIETTSILNRLAK